VPSRHRGSGKESCGRRVVPLRSRSALLVVLCQARGRRACRISHFPSHQPVQWQEARCSAASKAHSRELGVDDHVGETQPRSLARPTRGCLHARGRARRFCGTPPSLAHAASRRPSCETDHDPLWPLWNGRRINGLAMKWWPLSNTVVNPHPSPSQGVECGRITAQREPRPPDPPVCAASRSSRKPPGHRASAVPGPAARRLTPTTRQPLWRPRTWGQFSVRGTFSPGGHASRSDERSGPGAPRTRRFGQTAGGRGSRQRGSRHRRHRAAPPPAPPPAAADATDRHDHGAAVAHGAPSAAVWQAAPNGWPPARRGRHVAGAARGGGAGALLRGGATRALGRPAAASRPAPPRLPVGRDSTRRRRWCRLTVTPAAPTRRRGGCQTWGEGGASAAPRAAAATHRLPPWVGRGRGGRPPPALPHARRCGDAPSAVSGPRWSRRAGNRFFFLLLACARRSCGRNQTCSTAAGRPTPPARAPTRAPLADSGGWLAFLGPCRSTRRPLRCRLAAVPHG